MTANPTARVERTSTPVTTIVSVKRSKSFMLTPLNTPGGGSLPLPPECAGKKNRPTLPSPPLRGHPATPPKPATAKTLRGATPWRAQGAPSSSALRLCRPPAAPSLRSGREPTPCTCRPRWRGPGPRRVCENSHGQTIQAQPRCRIIQERI